MASGSTGSPWHIPYPVGEDAYQLTADLAGLVSQVSSNLSQIASTVDGKAENEHTHLQADVSGLEDALAGKAPLAHTHQISDVSGLSEALLELTRDTGWRDITGSLRNGWTATYVHIRRIRERVIMRHNGLDGTAATSNQFIALATGFAVARMQFEMLLNNSSATVQASGALNVSTLADVRERAPQTYATEYNGWDMPDAAFPSTYPGDPI